MPIAERKPLLFPIQGSKKESSINCRAWFWPFHKWSKWGGFEGNSYSDCWGHRYEVQFRDCLTCNMRCFRRAVVTKEG